MVDSLTSNNCESFNSTIVGLRGKSILTMLEELKFYIMKTMTTHKDALMAYTRHIAPIQVSRLEKEKKQANYWEAKWCGDDDHNEFEVRKWQHRVRVNTRERTCSCRKWQLTGLPCCHGIAAIQRKNEKPEDYVHHKLTIEAYNRTYQFHINSIPSQEYWEHHEGLLCLPPPYKRPIGRPSKKRKKDSSEQDSGSQYNAKRRYGQITFIHCLATKVGHNSRTCSERSTGAASQETMEAAHAAHVADEENLTQNHSESQPDEVFWGKTCVILGLRYVTLDTYGL
ncbi:uncharacterized protein LOC107469442 [Arachis duranensis]|uniref:Uncharacterized protein LOC107469442 n=1 Tax=Arachis duranensis TaxID=130453 RepID=A0A6P4BLQ9_ARADU|nr:uncharacterized protein LOC107469442 [Arachis duranensis]